MSDTKFGHFMERIDVRAGRLGDELPLLSVSQTRGVVRFSDLNDRPPRADSFDAYKIVEPGDIAFNKMSIRSGALGVAAERGIVTYHYEVMRPRPNADARFVSYLMKSIWFISELIRRERGIGAGGAAGVRTTEVPFSVMKSISVPFFSPEEQRQIADYLDHETAEIDALIADLEQTRLLRQELWKVTRDNLLTSGAQASGPVQTVESTWLGSMDSMWQEGPFKRLFDVSLGKMLDEKRHAEGDELLPYVRAGNIEDGRLNLDDLKAMPFNSREQSTYDLRKGDMLVVEGGSVGTNVVLDADLDGIFFQKTVNRARAHSDASPHFYSEVLNAYRDRGVFDVVANKSTIMHLTAEKLANLEVPIPPFETQHLIVAHLRTQRTELDFVAADMSAAVAMAQERRAALINDAVTGQIDATDRRRGPSEAERLESELARTQ